MTQPPCSCHFVELIFRSAGSSNILDDSPVALQAPVAIIETVIQSMPRRCFIHQPSETQNLHCRETAEVLSF